MLELKDKVLAKDELEEGRAVQIALMPERNPKIPGWSAWLYTRPANEVGGDMVDFIQIDENRYGIALGDVAGKGLRAALLMSKLQSTLRALVKDFTSLAELAKKINTIFYRDSLPNIFASLVYFELKSDSGEISMFNAGHLPPLILKGETVEELKKGAPALGLSDQTSFFEKKVLLNEEELFVAYSDGISEARNEFGEFFGEERLKQLLPKFKGYSPEQAGEKILAVIEHFVGDTKYHDDLSIVIFKRIKNI